MEEQFEGEEIDQKVFDKAMNDWDERRRKRALRALFERTSLGCDLTDYNRFTRVFLWLKTLICLLLKRTGGSYLDGNSFCILAYDECSGGEGGGSSWEAVWVCSDYFSDWQVCVGSDGT